MFSQMILNVVIGSAILGLLIYRQLRARPVRANQRLLLALAVLGLVETVQYMQQQHAGSAASSRLPAAWCWRASSVRFGPRRSGLSALSDWTRRLCRRSVRRESERQQAGHRGPKPTAAWPTTPASPAPFPSMLKFSRSTPARAGRCCAGYPDYAVRVTMRAGRRPAPGSSSTSAAGLRRPSFRC
jgi:hypothetical protein